MPINGIKAILFDLDGTLRESRPMAGEIFSNYALEKGLPVTALSRQVAARWEHYYFANSPELQQDNQIFNGDEKAFWQNFGRRRLVALGCTGEQADALAPEFGDYMDENYKPDNIIPDGVFGVLETLRDDGYALGVVSNRSNPYHDYLEELELAKHFSFSLAAGEVNSWKPDAQIFKEALKRIDADAHETVYVGDNYFADVVGARKAGLKPVLYDWRGIFDDPDCPVFTNFSQFQPLIRSHPWPGNKK